MLTVELAVVDGDRKQACKEILGAASDEDLKALRVPAKFAFMQVMKDSGPVDDEEYALWGRMYACHVTEDLKPCFVRELAEGMLQFSQTAEYENMRAYWPCLSAEEKLSCLKHVSRSLCENLGVSMPAWNQGEKLPKNVSGRYSAQKHAIEMNPETHPFKTMRGGIFTTVHETTHALQVHMFQNRAHLPAALQEQAEVFFWNHCFYIPSRLKALYREQPMEKQANAVAGMVVLVLNKIGLLSPFPPQAAGVRVLQGKPVPCPGGRT
ncbi:MAG TPA: hypothetical protein DCW68_03900 [Rhodospirillaceae bacterium]|nr:MAG: hypothetical protein A2018_07085 [Alphaproteobacteria bacterium GWF2_58_20]HAU29238.1 hypothetical protein [Rhodospirillaceae bacterium]